MLTETEVREFNVATLRSYITQLRGQLELLEEEIQALHECEERYRADIKLVEEELFRKESQSGQNGN